METKSINPDELVAGMKLLSIKTQQVFTVLSTEDESKVEIANGEDVKMLSHSTLKRWYRIVVTTDEAQPEQVTEEQPNEDNEIQSPPIQPAIPVTTNRRAPNSQQVDPVLSALRQRLIDEVLSVCPNATSRETSSYTGLRVGKYNFGEIYFGKRRFSLRIIGKSLTDDQAALCALAPASYRWTLDATFTVLVEDDFETALSLLKTSYAYRVQNTPQRGGATR